MYQASAHALVQASQKGFTPAEVLAAADNPQISYDNGRFPGQRRHIRNGLVAVVDPARQIVVTIYENVKETEVRADQTDKDAQRYTARRGQKARQTKRKGA